MGFVDVDFFVSWRLSYFNSRLSTFNSQLSESRKLRGGLMELGRLLICVFQKHVANVKSILYLCRLQ